MAKLKFSWRLRGHRLRVTRLALGITEKEAADAHGVSLQTYRRWEAGGQQRGSQFVDFAEKYNVSLNWLVCGETGPIWRSTRAARLRSYRPRGLNIEGRGNATSVRCFLIRQPNLLKGRSARNGRSFKTQSSGG